MMMLLAALLSLVIGVLLGMLGGGGAILTLPMLVYAIDVEPKAAIATSLFVVGATSLAATVMNARSRMVEWRIGLAFGVAAMAGAFTGGRLASFVPANVLLVLFAVIMLVAAIAMLKERAEPSSSPKTAAATIALGRVLALGVAVGVVSGLVGAGGGFLIVPALAILERLAMKKAIATSLFIITLQSFAGFAGHIDHARALDWSVIAVVTSASVFGMVIGTFVGRRVPANKLRRGFGWLVLAMGIFVIGKQVSSLLITALVATFALTAVLLVTRARRPTQMNQQP